MFCRELILNKHRNFLMMTLLSWCHLCIEQSVWFSPPVFYHNSQVINSIGTFKHLSHLSTSFCMPDAHCLLQDDFNGNVAI